MTQLSLFEFPDTGGLTGSLHPEPDASPRFYVKVPTVISAMRWDGTALGATRVINWILQENGNAYYTCTTVPCNGQDENHELTIQTLEGMMRAEPGSYVIKGDKGEFYPCRGDIFLETYTAWSPEEGSNDE